MNYKLKTGPTLEPVTLAEAKLHLKLDSDTTDDTLITALIQAAREQAEKYTGRAFIEQTWEAVMECFEDDDFYLFPSPLASVTSITYKDVNQVTQTLSSSVYEVNLYEEPGEVHLKYQQSWPQVLAIENSILVTYKVGYGAAASAVPASIKAAILLLIGDLYEFRHNTITGTIVSEINRPAMALLDPYRVYNL